MTREQLEKALVIDNLISTLDRRQEMLVVGINNSFHGSFPETAVFGDDSKDEIKLLKDLILREVDITINKRRRELEKQLAEI